MLAWHDYPCWYSVAPAESLRVLCLHALGANPVALTMTVPAEGDGVGVQVMCTALEPWASDDIGVLEAFDIPRLVRRADGYERRPLCGSDLSEVHTPLTGDECRVVAVARDVLGNVKAREYMARIEAGIAERLEQARYDASLHGHDARIDYALPPWTLSLRFHLMGDVEALCASCPDTRPDVDEAAA
jgi:hypothetical protein